MCGIVGYIGKEEAKEPILKGLQALEYRGYDSAGISLLDKSGIKTIKHIGRVEMLEAAVHNADIKSYRNGIGHTRWATHGVPSNTNAHPHMSNSGEIAIVHNGIVENHQILRKKLMTAGFNFKSQTDTEVIPNLIEYYLRKTKDIYEAFKLAVSELEGAYAIAGTYSGRPDAIYVARLSSPVVIGTSAKGNFIASDPTAIITYTDKVVYLDDYEIAEVTDSRFKIEDIKHNKNTSRKPETVDIASESLAKDGYAHYMLKEINEAPQTMQSATTGRLRPEGRIVKLGGLETVTEQLRYIDRIVIVACGTSYYAGLVGEYLIEEIAGIPVEVQLASEFKYRKEPFSRSTALLALSQSGETADTIAAIKKVDQYGVLKLGIVNAVGSTIPRMTDAGVYCHAGPERSVASTKAFIAQVTVLAEIALHLCRGNSELYSPIFDELISLPNKLKNVLKLSKTIESYAKKFCNYNDFLYVGRGYEYPLALEGALKLKEVSYIHAEGCAAGEMKHGPLAMIDEHFPTFAFATNCPTLDKTMSNLQEIKARSGPILAVATEGNKNIKTITKDVIYVPETMPQLAPILLATVTQLFAYHVALQKGLDIDMPRNIAKSVTVE